MVFLPPAQTRLVTIIAHVDHGKTTLADNLIESNGIISERLAGTLRYLDSMEEEQRRGITMRASAIGLRHAYSCKSKQPQSAPVSQEIVIHLLDSPGHTDFAPEVSSSLQICDGALLVVDAVEGMCARTHQVLREAHLHQLVPILVINKIDRLCTELCLSPTEAYVRLRNLLENVNAASAAMLNANNAQETNSPQDEEQMWTFEPSKGNVIFGSALYGWGFTVQSLAKSLFRSKLLPIKPPVLRQFLFSDCKYQGGKVLKWKQQSSSEPLFAEYALRPLWQIYEGVASAAADAGISSDLFTDGRVSSIQTQTRTTSEANHSKIKTKINSSLPGMEQVLSNMAIGATSPLVPTNPQEMQSILGKTGASSEESVLRSLLRRYRPLSDAVLDAVCEICPNPSEAAGSVRLRALALRPPLHSNVIPDFPKIQRAVSTCDITPGNSTPTVAHICKFMTVDRAHLRDPGLPNIVAEEESCSSKNSLILGLARVLSGRLRTEDVKYYVYGPKYEAREGASPPQRTIRLYLLMGSSFVAVNEVPAGHLCAIYNLEDVQLKTLTLCDHPNSMPLKGFDLGMRPLVKVNVEPVNAADMDALERGLVKLSLADAAVEVTATAKGERILACLGELHMEQSILDLETVYCGKEMKLRISDPIVEFGETTHWFENETDYEAFFNDSSPPLRQVGIPPYCEEEGIGYAHRGRTRTILSGRGAAIGLRVVPLAESVFRSLQEKQVVDGSEEELMRIGNALKCGAYDAKGVLSCLRTALCGLDSNGNAIVETKGISTGSYVMGVVSDAGVAHASSSHKEKETKDTSNIDCDSDEVYEILQKRVRDGGWIGLPTLDQTKDKDASALVIWNNEMKGSVVAGFQLAMRYGPLCEEGVRGVLVILESVEITLQDQKDKGDSLQKFTSAKPLSGGMVVAALRSGTRCALLTRPARLMEGHLRLTLHSSLAGLRSLYTVLSKRRGKVLTDDMVEGTDLLLITAEIPQAESFRLTPELLRQSSGEVTAPELIFSHWEILATDPFWIPTTLEEREDFGEILMNGDLSTGIDNNALKYIRTVRKRKGLLVDSARTVIAAEKQRTLKR